MSVLNGERWLSQAVESILQQTLEDFEFIIINDGSTDGTRDILAEYASTDGRIRVYHQANLGLISSLNKGCELARGEYIARMDADDVAFPDRFEKQLEFLTRQPAVALLGGGISEVDETGQHLRTLSFPTTSLAIREHLQHGNCFAHPTVMFKKAAFFELGGYRRAFLHAEEYDLWLRMAEKYEVANLTVPVLYYRLHPNQVSGRHLAQQVLSAVGALFAAQCRLQNGSDPFDHIESISADLLHSLGVPRRTMGLAMSEAFTALAEVCSEDQLSAIASRIMANEDAASFKDFMPKDILARLYKLSARQDFKNGARLRGVKLELQALVVAPHRVRKSVYGHLRRGWEYLRQSR
jgi:Glycosyltransferases involved in cell wall biogenesis